MAVPARLLRPAPHGRRSDVRPDLKVAPARGAKQQISGRRLWPMVATVCLALSLIFGVLLEQVILAQSAFELSNVREELAEARSLHEELLLEAATLESPGRIETYARRKIGMVDPDPSTTQYVVADIDAKHSARGGLTAGPALVIQGGSVAVEGAP